MTEQGVRLTLGFGSRRLQESGSAGTPNATYCNQVLQDSVRDRIQNEVVAEIPMYETMAVHLSNVSTSTDAPTTRSLLFDVVIEIRSAVTTYDVVRYVTGPFDTQAKKTSFAEFLRSTGCPDFKNLTSVELIVPGANVASNQKPPDSSSSSSTGLILGVAIACVAVVMILATFLYIKIRNRSNISDADETLPVAENRKDSPYEYATEIGVSKDTDVSTLGDPVLPGSDGKYGNDSSTIGSVALDYDYQKAYVGAQSIADSHVADSMDGSSPAVATLDDTSLSSDIRTATDETFGTARFGGSGPSLGSSDIRTATDGSQGSRYGRPEERYEIVAPRGLLGLILESNAEDGRPTVNTVKPTSVLANVVKVGDRLLSVDGQDITTMKAVDASRIIALKKDKNSRVLVFTRPMNRTTYSIQEEDANE